MVHIDRDANGEPIIPQVPLSEYRTDPVLHVLIYPRPDGNYVIRGEKVSFSCYLQNQHFLPRYLDIIYGDTDDATPHLCRRHPYFACTPSQQEWLSRDPTSKQRMGNHHHSRSR